MIPSLSWNNQAEYEKWLVTEIVEYMTLGGWTLQELFDRQDELDYHGFNPVNGRTKREVVELLKKHGYDKQGRALALTVAKGVVEVVRAHPVAAAVVTASAGVFALAAHRDEVEVAVSDALCDAELSWIGIETELETTWMEVKSFFCDW